MQIRTDLALEAREMIDEKRLTYVSEKRLPEGITVDTEDKDFLKVTRIKVDGPEAEKQIGKKRGNYVTLELTAAELNTNDIHREVSYTIAEELKEFIKGVYKKDPLIMIIGLGNRYITPDSLGPKVVEKIIVTRHAKRSEQLRDKIDSRLGNVCAISPGVMGVTGVETAEIISGLVEKTNPDIIIVIDALAARRTSRVNTTVQITDTGIVPGSGVGNRRMEISNDTLGIPVIAVGVPTVVDVYTLAKDLLEDIDGCELEESMDEAVAVRCGKEMVVTPKNIDMAVERMSTAISNGINLAVHKGFDFGDITEYLM